MMAKLYVLDACALIAYFREEPGNGAMADLFSEAAAKSIIIEMHKVTLTEMVYDMLRTDRTKTATELINDVRRLPVSLTDVLSDDFISAAAYFKANYKISFADCFVLALAQVNDATVMTADHHEFDAVEKSGEVKFHWFR